MYKRILSALLCLCMLVGPVPVWASSTLTINSAAEFAQFAKNCRTDTYSKGLQVTLGSDIDLSEYENTVVPYFAGSFDGGGHTIKGISIKTTGSLCGLFRSLDKGAVVKNLNLQGVIEPGGSAAFAGGIAGQNAGTVQNCSFNGTVHGSRYVGGIVGINTSGGVVENCTTGGTVYASHFVGGIVGENYGVVRNCQNKARVNASASQNEVGLDDVSLQNMLASESSSAATDIGGIAGQNAGVIKNCQNAAAIGYRKMGYNVGGIAGSSAGYIVGCQNSGNINGRKEVGGIVGQMEPVVQIEFTADVMNKLQSELKQVSSLANSAAGTMQNGTDDMAAEMENIKQQTDAAMGALDDLMSSDERLPDNDSLTAAQNVVSSSVNGISSAANGMLDSAKDTGTSLMSTLEKIIGRMENMIGTLQNAGNSLGVDIKDVSDSDTDKDQTGKVESCQNYGNVTGDVNAGGIAGAMSVENEFDHEDDLSLQGDFSLNVKNELRSVVKNCQNSAAVTVYKQCGGGIVGMQLLGLVKGCQNTADIDGQSGDYAGGIAGQSYGYLRNNYAKCAVSAAQYAGGIAGLGSTVTDCISMCRPKANEKLGEVLGDRHDGEIAGNQYTAVGEDKGGIDGVSFGGATISLSKTEFLKMHNLPEIFKFVTVIFAADGNATEIKLVPGSELKETDIPPVPQRDNAVGYWKGLAECDTQNIEYDMTFTAAYLGHDNAIESDLKDENGLPLLLLQGDFTPDATVKLQRFDSLLEIEGRAVVECYCFDINGEGSVIKGRVKLPDDLTAKEVMIYVSGNGPDRKVDHVSNGSYLVFELQPGDNRVSIVKAQSLTGLIIAAGSVLSITAAAGAWIWYKRKNKKEQKETVTP